MRCTERHSRRWTSWVVAVFAAAVLVAPAVLAQDVKPLLDRLERLERDIRTLNKQIARGGPTSGIEGGAGSASRMEDRLAALDSDLRVATSSMEEIGHRINQIGQRLDKLVGDVDFRLSALETRAAQSQPMSAQPNISAAPSPPSVQTMAPAGGFATAAQALGTIPAGALSGEAAEQTGQSPQPAASAQQAAVATPPVADVLPAGTLKERYAFAFGLLRQAQYDRAEIALRAFVDAHGDDPLASNARYWLGETFYVRAAYVQAAETFLEGYQRDPKGGKAPDTLLKLGMSLAGLDKKPEACAAFDKVAADFPKASPGVKNALKRERKRNNCS